jgi:penicillin-binding protein 1C
VDLPPRYAEWAATAGLPRLASVGVSPARRAAPELDSRRVRVRVTSPENGLRILRDPETPHAQSTVALRAVVEPAVSQVVWYVDGRPYQAVDEPYTTRLPLVPGEHVIEARLPNIEARSGRVKVFVE